MKVYTTDLLRNVALVGHGQSGKTSISEVALSYAGLTDRLGSVEEGTTVSDSDPEEISRKTSISLAFLPFEWEGCKINLLDTPGYADFGGDVVAALRVADGVVVVVDAAAGVEVQTERYAAAAAEKDLPRLIVISKLDREYTDFARTLSAVRENLRCNAVAVSIPVGSQTQLSGVIDLVKGVCYTPSQGKESEAPIPEEMAATVHEYREKLVEAAAEADDQLMEKYLEEETLSPKEIVRGLRAATLAGKVVPTLAVSASKMVGLRTLLNTIVADLPPPNEMGPVKGTNPRSSQQEERPVDPEAPLSALVFKTIADPYAGRLTCFRVYSGTLHSDVQVYNATRDERERIGTLLCPVGKKQEAVSIVPAGDIGLLAKLHSTVTGDTLCAEASPIVLPGVDFPIPVFSLAISAKSRSDEDKVGSALARLSEEDPTIQFAMNPDTKESILSGLGDLHLEVTVSRLQRKFGVAVQTGAPKIPYKETVRGTARVQGRFKRQTGGRGQFGDVWVRVEPRARSEGFEFVDAVRGGAVPRNFIPAVEKGIREALGKGVLAGYPMTDLRAILDDGSSHPVDSSDMAFKIAGSIALQKATEEAGVILLEPVVEVDVTTPGDQMGDVIGVLNSKRASILGMEPRGGSQVVRATVPLAELSNFASELRSITGGRGTYSMQFSHYQEVPAHLAPAIVEAAKKEKEE
ncbi:MAG TPA: elongation factor G [Armatimonadota bacterium]|nr:elongation factor G [Armatimonadota bacterium]